MIHLLSPLLPQLSSLELLTGLASTPRGLSFFMPSPTDPYSSSGSGFPMIEFKSSSLNFLLDGVGTGSSYGSFQGAPETNGKLLFPFEDLKQQVSSNNGDQNRDDNDDSNGYLGEYMNYLREINEFIFVSSWWITFCCGPYECAIIQILVLI
ncbi:dof zinc finger protein 1-like [Salvia miltiorrhiza]|uniref:dof zinc finger protein 1-like n=1 Tax=Salvia miltiorrhiza TaxID=226208 RepID=UPI0025AD00E1|nr:dof zinc finger protein 1-like [Salvia miltiorrhiza]